MAASTQKLTGNFNQQVNEVANLIETRISAKYSKQIADKYVAEWRAYAAKNKGKGTVAQLYLAFFLTQSNLPQNLGNDIITGVKVAAGSAAAIPQNVQSLSPTQLASGIWSTLTNHNLWVRVGEAVVAIILLDVGLKAFTGNSVIETVAKKTPAGKVFK
jgi:hypothetical protein